MHVAALPRQPRQPTALGAEHEQQWGVRDREIEQRLVATRRRVPTHHTPARLARSSAPGMPDTNATDRYSERTRRSLGHRGRQPHGTMRREHDARRACRLGRAHHCAQVLRIGDAVERDQERERDRRAGRRDRPPAPARRTRPRPAAPRCGPCVRSARPGRGGRGPARPRRARAISSSSGPSSALFDSQRSCTFRRPASKSSRTARRPSTCWPRSSRPFFSRPCPGT